MVSHNEHRRPQTGDTHPAHFSALGNVAIPFGDPGAPSLGQRGLIPRHKMTQEAKVGRRKAPGIPREAPDHPSRSSLGPQAG